MIIAAYIGLAIAGLVVGSLLTMVIDRVPDRLSLISPAPRCPYCERTLAAADLVPVVSWIRLRGRCRHCDHAITPAYPAVEIVTAVAFVVAAARVGFRWALVPVLVFFSALIAMSVVDLYRYRIPNRILFPALGCSVVSIVVVSVVDGQPSHIRTALVGAIIYFGLLLVPHLVWPRGMGFGDVKLALLLGLFLGWVHDDVVLGLRLILIALLLGAALASVGGIALMLTRKLTRREVLPDPEAVEDQDLRILSNAVPFGPALALSAGAALLYSDAMLGL